MCFLATDTTNKREGVVIHTRGILLVGVVIVVAWDGLRAQHESLHGTTTTADRRWAQRVNHRMEKWFNGSKLWLLGNQLQLLPKRYHFTLYFKKMVKTLNPQIDLESVSFVVVKMR